MADIIYSSTNTGFSNDSGYSSTYSETEDFLAEAKSPPGSYFKDMQDVESKKRDALAINNNYAHEKSSTALVAADEKSTTKDIIKGGRNMFRGTKTPSKFRRAATDKTELKAYDFYRDGKVERYELPGVHADGTKDFGARYEPVPELVSSISDDWKGALASIKLVDTSKAASNSPGDHNTGQIIPSFTKFFLEGIQENQQEKVQIVETFNDFYAFFYGEKPPIYTFSGTLLNLKNYNWLNEFTYYYQNFWRGTKAVELGTRVFLTYNYQQVQGYILSMNTNINAVTDKAAPFSFQFLVTKRLIFNQAHSETLFVDNLLPKPKVAGDGLDTKADNFATALTQEYLQGTVPASSIISQNQANVAQYISSRKRSKQKEIRNQRILQQEAVSREREHIARTQSANSGFLNANTPSSGASIARRGNQQASAMTAAMNINSIKGPTLGS